jgi:hypothetical protein
MFDSVTLRPVIIAMTLYIAISIIVPKLVKKPTGVKLVDDEVMYLMAQKGFLVSGVILIGIIMYSTNYITTRVIE